MMDLVPDRWYLILSSSEIPAGAPVAFRRMGQDLVLWRDDSGRVHAAVDRCPHRAAALSLGTIEQGCLTCPFHGFRFEPSGRCTEIPAHPDRPISPKMQLQIVEVTEAHDFVWAWSGPRPAPDTAPPFFELEGTWRGSQQISPLAVHYTRAIENQLDFAHLAFVHRTTIGRFASVEVDVQVQTDGDHLYTGLPEDPGAIHFIGPNVWRLRIGPSTIGFLGYAPVDDAHMVYYNRTYEGAPLPAPLSWVLRPINRWFGRRVLAQDHRVVQTQQPRRSSLDNGEIYVASDRAIIAYLKWRRHASQQAAAAK